MLHEAACLGIPEVRTSHRATLALPDAVHDLNREGYNPEGSGSGLSSHSIAEVHREIVDEFEFLDDWMDRYQHIIDLGRQLPEFPATYQTEEYKVRGCQAQVWLRAECREGRMYFQATSDAAIVSGLIAILVRAYSGFAPREILHAGSGFIDEVGFREHLSATRGNGLYAMLRTILSHAAAALRD